MGDEIDAISTIDPLLGEVGETHITSPFIRGRIMSRRPTIMALKTIKEELDWWEPKLINEGKLRKHSDSISERCLTWK